MKRMEARTDQLKALVESVLKEVFECKEFKRILTNAVRQATWDVIRARDREDRKRQPSADGFASVNQAAVFLSMSAVSIYRMVADGELPSIRVRESIRIPWQALRSSSEKPKRNKKTGD